MRCKHPYSKNLGFTLIELLVAISILAIVAVLGWRGLDGIVRTRASLTAELDETRSLQLTFAQLQSDCSQNANPMSYPNLPEARSIWIEPQRLILIRSEYADNQAPAMQVVVYQIDGTNLTRFSSFPTRDLAVLKQLLEQASNPPENQLTVVMQKDVTDIEFKGYPEDLEGANSDSDNEDNPPQSPDVPKAPPNPKSDQKNDPKKDQQPGTPKQVPPDPKLSQAKVTTGLQVSLRLKNHDNNIVKIFMLGGA